MLRGIASFLLVAAVVGSVAAADSCEGRCGAPVNPNYDCQCNQACTSYGDCCADYAAVCLRGSCKNKCDTVGTNSSWPCQCNKPCLDYGDCCPDYVDECGAAPGTVTDEELRQISEELLSLEGTNNAASYIKIDLQAETTQGSTADRAPNPLLTVQSGAYSRPTIQLLRQLHDNYIPQVNQNEVITPEEWQEQAAFLDAIFSTPVFQRARQFLISKGFLTESNFRATFEEIWFGQYSRSTGVAGSSGFEHVFLGELNNGVSGFHNWVYFSIEEAKGDLDYHGYLEYATFGSKGSLVGHNFEWRNNQKPISSMLVGTSPELELSIFTICWYSRRNAICPMALNGTKIDVTTYDISYNGKKYVATSYADAA